MSNIKKRQDSPPPGAPLWFTTYSDLITQILIFFVALFALSSVNKEKFEAVSQSLQSAFGVLQGGSGVNPINPLGESQLPDNIDVDAQTLEQLQQMYSQAEEFLEQQGLTGAAQAVMQDRGVVIRFGDSILFPVGEADLRPEAKQIVDKVGKFIAGIPNQVRVEGHTDNLPIHTERFPSNWELSTARATSVIQYLLQKTNVPPKRLSAAGYGEFRPITPNDTDANRAKNRRVDIVILRMDLSEGEPR